MVIFNPEINIGTIAAIFGISGSFLYRLHLYDKKVDEKHGENKLAFEKFQALILSKVQDSAFNILLAQNNLSKDLQAHIEADDFRHESSDKLLQAIQKSQEELDIYSHKTKHDLANSLHIIQLKLAEKGFTFDE